MDAASWNTHEAIIYTSTKMGLLLNLEVKQLNTLVFHFLMVSLVKYFGVDDAFSSETELGPLLSLLLSPLEQFGVRNNSPGEDDEPAAAAAAAASVTGSIGFTVFTFFSTSAAVGLFTATVSDTFDDVDTGGGGVGDFSSFAATGVGGDCLSFTAAAATGGGGDDDRFSIAACGPGDGGGDACFSFAGGSCFEIDTGAGVLVLLLLLFI